MPPAIVFLTGASGAGKTSIVRALRARDPEIGLVIDGEYLAITEY